MKKFISAILIIAFSIVAANAGVTNVKEVVNNTSETIKISKGTVSGIWSKETHRVVQTTFSIKEETGAILKGGTWSGDMWIPWVDNAVDFAKNVILIDIFERSPQADKKFMLWQSGDFVRLVKPFNDNFYEFVPNAPKISGEAKVNGERRLVVGKEDDKYVVRLEKF